MKSLQAVEKLAAQIADRVDLLADRLTAELAARVPEYQRGLGAAGEDPRAGIEGALAVLVAGLRDRDLSPAAGGQVRKMGAARHEAGIALDTLIEVVAVAREHLALAIDQAARELDVPERTVLNAERRLDRFAAGLIAELARGYMSAVTERSGRQHEAMAALVKVAAAINRSLELPDVAHAALSALLETMSGEVALLWLHGEDRPPRPGLHPRPALG